MTFLFRLRALLLCAGAITLCVSPVLPWLKLEVMGMHFTLPGFLWHGAGLWAVGAAILLLAISRWRRAPVCIFLLLLLGADWLWQDAEHIYTRGDIFLAQWQIKLAPLNDMLAKVNLSTLDIYRRSTPSERMGSGLYFAAAGWAGILSGWILGLVLEVRLGSGLLSVLTGSPRCRECGFSVGAGLRFCPGCGMNRTRKPGCRRCGEELGSGYQFCGHCGEVASLDAPIARPALPSVPSLALGSGEKESGSSGP